MNRNKKNVILDLDETLICSVPSEDLSDEQYLNLIGKVPLLAENSKIKL